MGAWIGAAVVIVLFFVIAVAIMARAEEPPPPPPPLSPPPLPRGPVGELATGMFMFGHLFRFDGAEWHSEMDPPPATEPVVALAGPPEHVFAVTWDGIYERVEGVWEKTHHSDVRLLHLWADDECVFVGGAQRTLLSLADGAWEQVEVPDTGPSVFGPIVRTARGDLYVAGNQFVMRRRDGEWEIQPVPTDDVIMGACALGEDVWLAVQSGHILRATPDGSWAIEHQGASSFGAICAAEGRVWAVGSLGQIAVSDGDGRWTTEESGTQNQLTAVGFAAGRVLVGDLGGRIYTRDDGHWSVIAGDSRAEVRDFWGTSGDLLVATSSFYANE